MSIDRGAVESSDRYGRDGHGGKNSGWWGKILGIVKFISFQQSLCIL